METYIDVVTLWPDRTGEPGEQIDRYFGPGTTPLRINKQENSILSTKDGERPGPDDHAYEQTVYVNPNTTPGKHWGASHPAPDGRPAVGELRLRLRRGIPNEEFPEKINHLLFPGRRISIQNPLGHTVLAVIERNYIR